METPNDPVVAQLWRYPVKSMQGERLTAVEVQPDGLDGDRRWGVRDEDTGRVLTGRREPHLSRPRPGSVSVPSPSSSSPTARASSERATRPTAP